MGKVVVGLDFSKGEWDDLERCALLDHRTPAQFIAWHMKCVVDDYLEGYDGPDPFYERELPDSDPNDLDGLLTK